MSENTKRILINITIVLSSIFLSVIISEVFLRVFIPKSIRRSEHHKLFVEYDSLLGWKKIPNKQGKHATSEYEIHENINSKGIRGHEYSYGKRDDEYRILILGDSFAEGYTVEFNEVFSEVLKRNLNIKGDKYYEVVNSGTGGYSTDQEYLFFQDEGKKYSPNLTVLMFYQNDVWYNTQSKYWRGYKPVFKLIDGKLRLTNVPVPKPKTISASYNKEGDSYQSAAYSEFSINAWFNDNSYLYKLISSQVVNNYYFQRLISKLVQTGDHLSKNNDSANNKKVKDAKVNFVPEEFRVWKKVYSPEIREAWKITEALIVKLKQEADMIGSEFVVFYIPDQSDIYAERWKAAKRKYGLSDEGWSAEQVRIELESICRKNVVDFINPAVQFSEEADRLKKAGKRLYFINDGHWNVDGHKLTGNVLTDYIKNNYLAKSRHK